MVCVSIKKLEARVQPRQEDSMQAKDFHMSTALNREATRRCRSQSKRVNYSSDGFVLLPTFPQ
jgi:hypothetical protein